MGLARRPATESVQALEEAPAAGTGRMAQPAGGPHQLVSRDVTLVDELVEDREVIERAEVVGEIEGEAGRRCHRDAVRSGVAVEGHDGRGLAEVGRPLRLTGGARAAPRSGAAPNVACGATRPGSRPSGR